VGAVTGRDFLREIDQQGLWIKAAEDTLWKKLIKDDYDALYAYYGDGLGKPLQYSLSNDVFTLHPTPDIAYDLRTKVYLREPALTTNIENKWLVNAADLLIAETGMIIASRYLRDDGLVIIFNDDIKQARKRLQDTHEAREHANRSYSMGGEDN
jgi:hypothetical protein